MRWRRKDLAHRIFEEFGIILDEMTGGRELKALGFAKLSARPRHHAQNELKVDAFEKISQPSWRPSGPSSRAGPTSRSGGRTNPPLATPACFRKPWALAHSARIGQKNKITRRWAKRGTRPSAPQDQRTMWAKLARGPAKRSMAGRTADGYIFGAICPKKGKGASLVLAPCDTGAIDRHLTEISATVDPGAHAVLILDQAGWHATPKLTVPDNITLLFRPPRAPALNQQENIWQFMRDNWLSNRIFADYDDIVGHCCEAWNKLVEQPWIIMSIGVRDWAHGF